MNSYYEISSNKSAACLKVFIIDAVPIIRQGLVHVINQKTDFTVCGEAGNALQALEAIDEHKPDIVITDLSCVKGIGLSPIKDIAVRFSGIPILVFSSQDESFFAERCLSAGAGGYVLKTESAETIVNAMRKLCNGEIYVSDYIQRNLLTRFFYKKPKDEVPIIETLSNRELEVYQHVGSGLKVREIADELNISVKTIGTHVERIKRKMNLKNTREVFMSAVHWRSGINAEEVRVSK